MRMEEPRVEYIEFGEEDVIVTSTGVGDPSVETCSGTNAPMNNCTPDDNWV